MGAENDNRPDALQPELEDTVELPVLSELAAERLMITTDSWQVPAVVRTAAPPTLKPTETAAAPGRLRPAVLPGALESAAGEASPPTLAWPLAAPLEPLHLLQLPELRARCERYLELLQDFEGRRALLESLIDEREQRLRERERHIESLERRLGEQARELGSAYARIARLETQPQAARRRWPWRWPSAPGSVGPAGSAAGRSATDPGPRGAPRAGRNPEPAVEQEPDAAAERLASPQPHAAPEPYAEQAPGGASEAGTPLAALVALGGGGTMVRLGARTTIGRLPDNDVCIAGDAVSRNHAVLLASGDQVVLEDLRSTNGTFVNGARVARCTLNDGDLLTIGRTRLRYVLHAPPA